MNYCIEHLGLSYFSQANQRVLKADFHSITTKTLGIFEDEKNNEMHLVRVKF